MRKILAIDDNEINLNLIGQIIKIHYPNFLFLKSLSGIDGIELAKKEQPELVLLDILMPQMDGYEVCEILKKEEITQHIPVIIISALGKDSKERTKGLDAGADSFISKPFSQNEIRAQINVALRIKRVEDLLRTRNKSLELLIKNQTQEYLQKEERALQFSEHAKEFYWEIGSDGKFTYVSPIIEKTLQIKPSEIVGTKSYLELFQLNNKNALKSEFEISFKTNSSFKNCEIKLKDKISEFPIWLSISGFSVFNENNDFYSLRGVCYDITKYKEAEITLKKNVSQINKYQKSLKKLHAELTNTEEKERRRIAENLHDGLGQTLSIAYIKLSSILNNNLSPGEKEIVVETSDLLNQAIIESRNLTYDLCPPILHELGLVPAIRWKLGQMEEKHNIKMYCIAMESEIQISNEYNILIYRIISELLNNIVKHANASEVNLKILKEKRLYNIIVQDNGIGIKKQSNKSKEIENRGFGLMSIIERLESINGKFSIESKPGIGTTATIVFPNQKRKMK